MIISTEGEKVLNKIQQPSLIKTLRMGLLWGSSGYESMLPLRECSFDLHARRNSQKEKKRKFTVSYSTFTDILHSPICWTTLQVNPSLNSCHMLLKKSEIKGEICQWWITFSSHFSVFPHLLILPFYCILVPCIVLICTASHVAEMK